MSLVDRCQSLKFLVGIDTATLEEYETIYVLLTVEWGRECDLV